MDQMVAIKSNAFLLQDDTKEKVSFLPQMELVIIHTDGKDYTWTKTGLNSKARFDEIRLIVTPDMLQELITQLQLHQTKLKQFRDNATELNAMIRLITEAQEENKPTEPKS